MACGQRDRRGRHSRCAQHGVGLTVTVNADTGAFMYVLSTVSNGRRSI